MLEIIEVRYVLDTVCSSLLQCCTFQLPGKNAVRYRKCLKRFELPDVWNVDKGGILRTEKRYENPKNVALDFPPVPFKAIITERISVIRVIINST